MSKKNPELIKKLKKMPCFVCGANGVDVDHIRTRGAGGDDSASNVWPLCRGCHQLRHSIGIKTFVTMYQLPVDVSGIYPKLEFEWNV